MPTIDTDNGELLLLFPKALPHLYVARLDDTPGVLDCVYAQHDTPDPQRAWRPLLRWREDVGTWQHDGCPGDTPPLSGDEIYLDCVTGLLARRFSPTDRLLLHVELTDSLHDPELPEEAVFLEFIRRNMAPDLVGLGAAFYRSLTRWLGDKGFRYLIDLPNHNKSAYWQTQGQVPLRSIPHLSERLPSLDPDVHFVHELG